MHPHGLRPCTPCRRARPPATIPPPPVPRALTEFLYGGGGPRYKVDAAFIWSVGTWDVAAIHPISTSEQGTYADWEIVKWMRWLTSKVVT